MKLLIADDEPRQRKGIANMLRRLQPESEVLEFKTGLEVCRYLENNSADVIFTDIKMPVMDGLQMFEQLREQAPDMAFIIISGYAYFEYAQKALTLGAFDYILKPVDQERIEQVLRKVTEKFKQDYREKIEKDRLEEKLDHALPAYLEVLLNKWIRKELAGHEQKEIEFLFQQNGVSAVIVSEISNYTLFQQEYAREEKEEVKIALKQWMKHTLDPVGHSISFFLEAQNQYMITVIQAETNPELTSSAQLRQFRQLQEDIRTSYGLVLTIGIGSMCTDLFGQIETSFSQAMTALRYKFFQGLGSVIPFTDICKELNRSQVYIRLSEEDELKELVRSLQREKASALMDSMLDRLKGDSCPDPVSFIETVTQVILNVINLTQTILMEDSYNDFLKRCRIGLQGCMEYTGLVRRVREILSDVMDILHSNKSIKNDNFARKFFNYMEEHYMEEVSLESAAKTFHINPCYFSSLLKNMTGATFSQTLLRTRMNKAKELLKEGDLRIYEIAEMIGYKDIRYFDRVFKKETGSSPEEYRKSLLVGRKVI